MYLIGLRPPTEVGGSDIVWELGEITFTSFSIQHRKRLSDGTAYSSMLSIQLVAVIFCALYSKGA